MEANWILTCLCEDILLDIRLDYQQEVRCVWRDPQTFEILLVLEKEDAWWIKDGSKIGLSSQPFLPSTLYPCIVHGKKALLYCEEQIKGNATYTLYELSPAAPITIGRSLCDLQYQSKHISKLHAQLVWEKKAWWIIDMDSSNGVYVNRRRTKKQIVRFGDRIYIMGLQIIMGDGWLALNHPQDKVRYRKGKLYEPKGSTCLPHLAKEVETFFLQTRFIPMYTMKEREVKDPPALQAAQPMPMMLTLGPSFTMGLASMSTALFSLQQAIANDAPLASVYPSLIMALSMMAGTILWPILLRAYERRQEEEQEHKRRSLYHQYLMQLQEEIKEDLQAYRKWLWLFHCEDPSMLLHQPQHLWNYVPEKGLICIGCADQAVPIPLQYQKQELKLVDDPLDKEKNAFVKKQHRIEHAPLYLHLAKHSLLYVVGNETQQKAYAIYLLLHLCLLYPPQQIVIVLAISSLTQFPAILRFLPHLFDADGNRYLCTTQKDVQQVLMQLYRQEKQVVILSFSSAFSTIFHFDRMQHISSTLFAFHNLDKRMQSEDEIHLRDHAGCFQHGDLKQTFSWSPISKVTKFASFLVRLPIADPTAAAFPKELDFLQLYDVDKVVHLQVYQHWQNSSSEHTLTALLGVNERNEPIALDLHEKAHGPHGIIAGMTGSGKSELLITLILSLAITYHPYDVSFIMIDYKGGGMAKAFEQLPHVAGIITNLDGSMIQRSLNSLDSELMRRQTIFSNTMKRLSYASMDIYTYQKLYHEHQVAEPLAHLVIIADEFAELKQQQPQFMEQLIRTARIGRSLGVHLLLATQKPSGVVDDQIWSNARFHICLKVADKADSIDMLKREDGALLSDTGRFFLQVGYNEIFHQGQCAYTKAMYQPEGRRPVASIKQLDACASLLQEWKRPIQAAEKQTQLQAIITHLQELAKLHEVHAHQLWLPILKERIDVALQDSCIAYIDDPAAQAQYPLTISLDSLRSTIAYGMHLLEIEELFTIVCEQLMYRYSPAELSIMLFDFEQHRFSSFQQLPHVFSVVSEEDEEDITYLCTYLQKELQERKKEPKAKRILIMIHHIAAFLEANEDYEALLYKLMRDGERVGIYVWISATTLQDVRFRLHQQCSQFFLYQLHDEQDAVSILNTKMILPSIHGRAIWKLQEQVYEIQTAHLSEAAKQKLHQALSKEAAGEQLLQIPAHIRVADIWRTYDKEHPWELPIGMDQMHRCVLKIDLRKAWLITGPGAPCFLSVLKQLPIPLDLQEVEEEITRETGLYSMKSTAIAEHSYAPWFQRLKLQQAILWIGEGLQELRYVFDIQQPITPCKRNEGYLLDDVLTRIRFMEEDE